MHKGELIQAVAANTTGTSGDPLTTRDVEEVVNETLRQITRTVAAGGEVVVTGFGKFSGRMIRPRNPETGEVLPARRTPTFKAGAHFKNAVRDG